jgi:hypothetical protein
MRDQSDLAPLIELLKMEAERWPRARTEEDVSEVELLWRDEAILEMRPEACRRSGVGWREFPAGVIELWKQSLGRAN